MLKISDKNKILKGVRGNKTYYMEGGRILIRNNANKEDKVLKQNNQPTNLLTEFYNQEKYPSNI